MTGFQANKHIISLDVAFIPDRKHIVLLKMSRKVFVIIKRLPILVNNEYLLLYIYYSIGLIKSQGLRTTET